MHEDNAPRGLQPQGPMGECRICGLSVVSHYVAGEMCLGDFGPKLPVLVRYEPERSPTILCGRCGYPKRFHDDPRAVGPVAHCPGFLNPETGEVEHADY